MKEFRALVVEKENDEVIFGVKKVTEEMLSEGDVLVEVEYSSINYKDSLAVQANGGVIRNYPMIPGIDMSGTVVSSDSNAFEVGDKVLATGFTLGVTHTGGFSEFVRVPADMLMKLPKRMTSREAMVIGTAGFTAALSILKLEAMGMHEDKNPQILVTGATGGVGSLAIQMLAKSGYTNISALSRKKKNEEQQLKMLGATTVYDESDLFGEKIKVLDTQRFDYIIDTVGGKIASQLIAQISYGGSMSMCGNAAGIAFDTTVLPFILRGVNVLGIDSVSYPIDAREAIWQRFTAEWNITDAAIVHEIRLDEVSQVFDALKNGTHVGRTIVKMK